MKHTTQTRWYFFGAALFLVLPAVGTLAAQTDFNLVGLGSGATLAGIYTSPYTAMIGGGPPVDVICDDFADDTFVPEDWTAYVTSLSSIVSGTADTSVLKWQPPIASAPTITETQAYEAAALLSIDILQNTGLTPVGTSQQQDYSFALWELFDPTDANNQLVSNGDTNDATYAQIYLNAALTEVTSSPSATAADLANYNVTIYSYDASAGAPTGACGGPCPAPQEFITVSMAEPPSAAVFAVYFLFGGGGLLFLGRRRILRAGN